MSLHPLRKDPDLIPVNRPVSPAALPAITMTTSHQAPRPEVPPATDSGGTPVPEPTAAPEPDKEASKLASLLGVVVGVSLAAVIVAPVTLSATHLIEWASSAAGLGLPLGLAWLVFVALDLAAVTCIGMVVLCAMRGESGGAFDVATWAFAFASAFANYSGSAGAGKWFFPAMSLAGPTLLHMVLAKMKSWARIKAGTKLSARPRFGVRWVPGIAFRETSKAWAAARRENITKAADAIAFVREMDIVAGMTDPDAVRYAQAAARTTDPHELRQWLTSRGKNVAQAALPMLPAAATVTAERVMDDDVAREGAPLSETFAPMPAKLRAPREALGLPAAPEPTRLPSTPTEYDYVREMAEKERAEKARRPRPVKDADVAPAVPIRRKRPQDHPKWAVTEATFRASIAKGAELSQRKLSDVVPVHRNIAKAVIDHVKNDLFPEES
jgi:hypothetical protein